MSSIDKISIQGIRSFDPYKPQVLDFFKPVTLILGQNGSGKTTIIESLKYATTGDLPPGSKVGASFIHDPKIAKETEVKAKITLQMQDLKGAEISVSRALKAVQKDNKQTSMQTLDSCIKRKQEDGQAISISSKCADIDFEVTNSLGVSKAVLDSVIFCHQEESNWPLMEGKVVKQRFDDLFASARYVKVLDAVRKTKIDKDSNIRLYKAELKYLQSDRDDAVKKMEEKAHIEMVVKSLQKQMDQMQDKLAPIQESLNQYQTQYKEICKIESQIQLKERDKLSNESQMNELQSNLTQTYDGSIDELKEKISELHKETSTSNQSIKDNEKRIVGLRKEISGWEKSNGESLVSKGSLQIKMEHLRTNQGRFQQSIKKLASDLKIECDDECPSLMMLRFKDQVREEELMLEKKKKVDEEEISCQQSGIDSKYGEKTKLQHECDSLERELMKQRKELSDLEKQLSEIDKSSSKLDQIASKTCDLKIKLTNLKTTFDPQAHREKTEEMSTSLKDLEKKLEEMNDTVNKYQSEENKYREMERLKQQQIDKANNIKRLRSRHSDIFEKLFESNNTPETGMRKKLNEKLNNLRARNQDLQTEYQQCQSRNTTLNVEIKQLRSKICEKKTVIEKFEEKVFEVYGDFDFNKAMKQTREKKTNLEDELVSLQGTCMLYKRFQDNLNNTTTVDLDCDVPNKEEHNGSCPLCHRDFQQESEKKELMEEITQKIVDLPPILDRKSSELIVINEKFENLIKFESRAEHIDEIKNSQLSQLESSLEAKMKELGTVQESLLKVTGEKDRLSDMEKQANTIQGDVAVIEKLQEELIGINKQIASASDLATIDLTEFEKLLEKAKQQRLSMSIEVNKSKRNLEVKRNEYESCMKKENDLISEINKLEAERLTIQENVSEQSVLWSQKEKFAADIDVIGKELVEKRRSMDPVTVELNELREKLVAVKRQKNFEEGDLRDRISNIKSRISDMERTFTNIKKVEQEDFQTQLKALEEKRLNNGKKIEQHNIIITEIETVIDEIKSKISLKKVTQRDLEDTIRLRKHQDLLTKINVDIEELQKKLNGQDSSNLQMEESKLSTQRNELRKELDVLELKMAQNTTKSSYIDKELNQRLHGVEDKYLELLYKLKTTELASQDLDKYYRALDKSIMSYHSSKMEEINKILKELWRNTYSGSDIDYIEICSEDDTTGISGNTSRRRTYNYRVVMVKVGSLDTVSDIRLDMRGRCSAGQKVLASLLIRLALAEVFCIHCGLLALDEPTTNLDRDNIENLAYALVQIIKTRCRQKNFQLIVITHDEDFVQLLGRSDYVDQYYKIKCDSEGHSNVKKCGIE